MIIVAFLLPELPYEKGALVPYLSEETLDYHHGKHHNAYVAKLNDLIEGTEYVGRSLEEIIMTADGAVFNNAAQHWNHSFYWKCLKPSGGGAPDDELVAAMERDFGSLVAFREEFLMAAVTQFGSGWAWLVLDSGRLRVTKTNNADLPMKQGQMALLTIDVWEHAYYIDYRNLRPKYFETVMANLVNWDFVGENYRAAL
jgi:superoxide dismutase, Fe-Mn family